MTSKLRAYLELIRVGNLFSAAADVVAGYYYVGGGSADDGKVGWLIAASVCLYAGGVALNDACDADRDAVERPLRPIPSGRVTRAAAIRLSVTLIGMGTILAMSVSLASTVTAGMLVGAILLYNFHAKTTAWGPWVMGTCRALNLTLGMGLHANVATAPVICAMVLIGLHIASLTYFARDEAGTSPRSRLRLGAAGVAATTLGLCALPALQTVPRWTVVLAAIPFAGFLLWIGFRAAADPSPTRVQTGVRVYLISLIAFDAMLAAIGSGPGAAKFVAALALPMILLTTKFRAT